MNLIKSLWLRWKYRKAAVVPMPLQMPRYHIVPKPGRYEVLCERDL